MNSHLDALREATAAIQSHIDAGPLPGLAPTPCADYDVAALIDHINWTHGLLLGALGGETPESPDHRAISDAVLNAWVERGTDGAIAIGDNQLSAVFGLSLHILEVYVHGWDLARALERPFAPSPELTDIAWDAAQMIITDDARGPDGPYSEAIDVPAAAGDMARLIGFTGRDPSWEPSADE